MTPSISDHDVAGLWSSITGTTDDEDAVLEFEFFVPMNDANGDPVLDPDTGAFVSTITEVSGGGTWSATGEPITNDAGEADHALSLQSIAIQKAVEHLDGGEPTRPGDVLEWTLEIQVSDFFAFDSLVIDDHYADGLELTGTPHLTWSSSGNVSGSGDFDAAHFTHTPGTAATDGVSHLEFDLSAQIDAQSGDGRLVGGCVPPSGLEADNTPDCDAYNDGPTTATVTFQTVILEEYTEDYPSGYPQVVQGDELDNDVEIAGEVLEVADASTPTGSRPSDDSGAGVTIGVGTIEKAIYAVNGDTDVPGFLRAGDRVTYRIGYELPIPRFDQLTLIDYLPLPVFDVTDGGWSQVGDGSIPDPGEWSRYTGNTFTGVTPTVSTQPANNALLFEYGNFAADEPYESSTIDLLFTVTVRPDRFADGLFLTNQVRGLESSTSEAQSVADGIVQIQLGQPVLEIAKGVTSVPGHGSLGPDCDATTPVEAHDLDRLNCDASGVDAGDEIEFVVTIENTGHAPAYDATVRDLLPDGLTNASLVSATDGDGDSVDTSGNFFNEGVTFNDPIAGADQADDTTRIRLLTFTATLADAATVDTAYENTAEITEYSAEPGEVNHVPDPDGPPAASSTVTTAAPSVTKSIVDTSEDHTGGTDVAIGEVVTYEVVVTFPEGVTENATLEETLTGIELLACESYEADPDLEVASSGCSLPVPMEFGDVTSDASSGSEERTITLRYTGVVSNVEANQRGEEATNSARLTYDSGESNAAAAEATIVEPELQVAKAFSPSPVEAHDTVTLTMTVSHTGASDADAFDVTLADVLDDRLNYVNGSLACTGDASASVCSISDTEITVQWDGFGQADTATITLEAVVDETVATASSIANTADLDWTSLPGDQGTGNATPGEPGDVNGQRTGSGSVNDYATTGSDSLEIHGFSPDKTIVATSEAHTDGADVAIGEVITYRIETRIAQGTTPNLVVRDHLPAGMEYLADSATVGFVSAGDDLASDAGFNACDLTPGDLSNGDPLPCDVPAGNIEYAVGEDLDFVLGTITNSADNPAEDESIVLKFDALVRNVAANQDGSLLENTFVPIVDDRESATSDPVTVTVREPSIGVEKAIIDAPGNIDAGTVLTYELTLQNHNDMAGFDVVLRDELPAELSLDLASVAIGGFSSTTGCGDTTAAATDQSVGDSIEVSLTCLPPEASITVTFDATIDGEAIAGVEIENTSGVTYTSLPGDRGTDDAAPGDPGDEDGQRIGGIPSLDDPNDYDASDSTSFSVAEPEISKLAPDPDQGTIGEITTFDIVVTLPEGLTEDLVVTDTLPEGLQYMTDSARVLTDSGHPAIDQDYNGAIALDDVTIDGQDVILDLGSPQTANDGNPDNNTVVVQLQALVLNVAANQDGNTKVNRAVASWQVPGESEPRESDPADADPYTIVEPDLALSKAVDTSNGTEAGDVVTYTLTLEHGTNSSATAYDVSLSDTMPSELSAATPSIAEATGSCDNVSASAVNGTVSVSADAIPLDCSITVTVDATLGVGVTPGMTITNDAEVTWASIPEAEGGETTGRTGQPGDPLNDYHTEDDVTFAVDGVFSLVKALEDSNNPATSGSSLAIGETATFSLTATFFEGTTNDVVIVDDLPEGMRFIDGSHSVNAAGFDVTVDAPTVTCAGSCDSGDNVTFDLGQVVNPPGESNSIVIEFDAVVMDIAGNSGGDTLTNTASMTHADDTDPIDSNSVDVTVVEPNLVVTKSVDPASAASSETVEYTVRVENAGDGPAHNVVIEDLLPVGVADPVNLDAPSHGFALDFASDRARYTGGTVPAGGTAMLRFEATVQAGVTADADIVNTARADGRSMPDSIPDHDESRGTSDDDQATFTVTAPDLWVTKSADGSVTPGSTLTWEIDYGNADSSGIAPSSGVELTETVPDHTTFDPAGSASGWDCTDHAAGSECTYSIPDTLDPGDGGRVIFAVTVDNPLAAGVNEIENTISIDDDGAHGPDRDPSDNSDTRSTTAEAMPALHIEKDDDGITAWPDGPIVYELTYQNTGNQDATGVVLEETVPDGTTFEAGLSDPAWSCSSPDAGSTCTLEIGDLPTSESGAVDFVVRLDDVDTSVLDPIENTATISDDGENGDGSAPEDKTSSTTTPVLPAIALEVVKTVDRETVPVGDTVTYTVRVYNHGPGDADDVVVVDELPSEVTYTDHSGDGAYDVDSGEWAIGPIEAEAFAELSLEVSVQATGVIVNVATITEYTGVERGSGPYEDDAMTQGHLSTEPPPLPITPTPTPDPEGTPTPEPDETATPEPDEDDPSDDEQQTDEPGSTPSPAPEPSPTASPDPGATPAPEPTAAPTADDPTVDATADPEQPAATPGDDDEAVGGIGDEPVDPPAPADTGMGMGPAFPLTDGRGPFILLASLLIAGAGAGLVAWGVAHRHTTRR